MELRWILAVGAEATFWTLLVVFLLLRYRFGLERASIAVLVAIVLDHVVIFSLGAWDFARTGAVSPYTVAILALLVYALTCAKRDIVRLDAWAKRRFARDGRGDGDAQPADGASGSSGSEKPCDGWTKTRTGESGPTRSASMVEAAPLRARPLCS